eukprot:TRINITY_DN3895_c0_g1_i2.p1 TRINITY_DN3895_c0_g1~~TRINITY_DN3895_c0_g1_i2.p1  ORF type:complete len:631 (+),score=113.19 TRINITY_DN3895_c0_g1_i2:42-1934(+)
MGRSNLNMIQKGKGLPGATFELVSETVLSRTKWLFVLVECLRLCKNQYGLEIVPRSVFGLKLQERLVNILQEDRENIAPSPRLNDHYYRASDVFSALESIESIDVNAVYRLIFNLSTAPAEETHRIKIKSVSYNIKEGSPVEKEVFKIELSSVKKRAQRSSDVQNGDEEQGSLETARFPKRLEFDQSETTVEQSTPIQRLKIVNISEVFSSDTYASNEETPQRRSETEASPFRSVGMQRLWEQRRRTNTSIEDEEGNSFTRDRHQSSSGREMRFRAHSEANVSPTETPALRYARRSPSLVRYEKRSAIGSPLTLASTLSQRELAETKSFLARLKQIASGDSALRVLHLLERMPVVKAKEKLFSILTVPDGREIEDDIAGLSMEDIEYFRTAFAVFNVVSLHSSSLLIDALANILPSSLIAVNFSDNFLSNIGFLTAFPSLVFANLSHNRIEDITAFRSLTCLKTLILKDNRVKKLTGLHKLTGLAVLDCSFNQLRAFESVAVIAGLKSLQCVLFRGNPIHRSISYQTNLKLLFPKVQKIDPETLDEFIEPVELRNTLLEGYRKMVSPSPKRENSKVFGSTNSRKTGLSDSRTRGTYESGQSPPFVKPFEVERIEIDLKDSKLISFLQFTT